MRSMELTQHLGEATFLCCIFADQMINGLFLTESSSLNRPTHGVFTLPWQRTSWKRRTSICNIAMYYVIYPPAHFCCWHEPRPCLNARSVLPLLLLPLLLRRQRAGPSRPHRSTISNHRPPATRPTTVSVITLALLII